MAEARDDVKFKVMNILFCYLAFAKLKRLVLRDALRTANFPNDGASAYLATGRCIQTKLPLKSLLDAI